VTDAEVQAVGAADPADTGARVRASPGIDDDSGEGEQGHPLATAADGHAGRARPGDAAGARRPHLGPGRRGEVDERTESVGLKIREAELRKIPYMLVIGDREAEDGSVAVREHGGGDSGSMPIADFVARLSEQTLSRGA